MHNKKNFQQTTNNNQAFFGIFERCPLDKAAFLRYSSRCILRFLVVQFFKSSLKIKICWIKLKVAYKVSVRASNVTEPKSDIPRK